MFFTIYEIIKSLEETLTTFANASNEELKKNLNDPFINQPILTSEQNKGD